MLVFSINLRFLKERKVCLESSPRSDILDSVESFLRGPAGFIQMELVAGHSENLHLPTKLCLECIKVWVLGSQASVGGHVDQEDSLSPVVGEGDLLPPVQPVHAEVVQTPATLDTVLVEVGGEEAAGAAQQDGEQGQRQHG